MILSDPVIKDGMKKFVVYTVAGTALNGLSLIRRYSDFFSLREKLVERWPGVYIPNIPPKKVVGNLDNKLIESRMRMLNLFVYKLSKFKAIFESEEVKLFETNTNELSKAIEKLPKLSYEELLTRYKAAYPDYYEAYDLISGKGKLSEFLTFLKKSQTNLKYFKDNVDLSQSQKEEGINDYLSFLKGFEDYEKSSLMEYADGEEKKLVFFNAQNVEISEKVLKLKGLINNPFILLNEWLEEEKLDIEAMVSALSGLTTMNETYEKLNTKLEKIDNDLKALQYGHKSIFSFKNKDVAIAELQKEKTTTTDSMNNLHNIIKLASFNMESYLEIFKEEKINEYYLHIRMFSEMQKNNNIAMSDLWNLVGKRLNGLIEEKN